MRHDADYLALTQDLGVKMSLEEFDNLTERRIHRIMVSQDKRLKERERIMKEQKEKEARQNIRNNIMRK